MLSLIAAMGKNRVIGSNNRLPWSLPADLAYFKAITVGHTVVMGRKTYQSIGHPLTNRTNIVLSANPELQFAGCAMARTIDEILELSKKEDLFVIGGATVYREFLPCADKLYLTLIDAEFEGDVFFPELDSKWCLVSRRRGTQNSQNPFRYDFLVYERRVMN